ncbi:uncharacterized protein LOC135834101 [Planococcus citri]|uniref:uncharacterized protein LOC135834101 n=1 Tax=Planococcus citri TaxID=170843 RepID=UPI0031F83022
MPTKLIPFRQMVMQPFLHHAIAYHRNPNPRLPPPPNAASVPRPPPHNCYNCSSPYHYVWECPDWDKGPRCFKCGEWGHRSNECPNEYWDYHSGKHHRNNRKPFRPRNPSFRPRNNYRDGCPNQYSRNNRNYRNDRGYNSKKNWQMDRRKPTKPFWKKKGTGYQGQKDPKNKPPPKKDPKNVTDNKK